MSCKNNSNSSKSFWLKINDTWHVAPDAQERLVAVTSNISPNTVKFSGTAVSSGSSFVIVIVSDVGIVTVTVFPSGKSTSAVPPASTSFTTVKVPNVPDRDGDVAVDATLVNAEFFRFALSFTVAVKTPISGDAPSVLTTVIIRVERLVHVAVTVPIFCENEKRFKTSAFDSKLVVPLKGWFVDSENTIVKISPNQPFK